MLVFLILFGNLLILFGTCWYDLDFLVHDANFWHSEDHDDGDDDDKDDGDDDIGKDDDDDDIEVKAVVES